MTLSKKNNFRKIIAIGLTTLSVLLVNCINITEDGVIYNNTSQISTVGSDNASTMPTWIYISIGNDELLVGDTTLIKAQLYYNDEPLRKKNMNISFTLDNNSIASLPKQNYNQTDSSGATYMQLFTNKPGHAKITATYNSDCGILTNSTYIDVCRWGSIAGLALDKDGIGIPNGNITVWDSHYSTSNNKWENDGIKKTLENPQLSNDGRGASAGLFVFYRLKAGTYNISAERYGHLNSSIVTIENGTNTCLINLPDYKNNVTVINTSRIPSKTANGTIWGIICDQNRVAQRNANVSLWHCKYNQLTNLWERTTLVDLPKNPQYSSDGKIVAIGEYRFDDVPNGTYYINGERNGQENNAIVQINQNLSINFIALYQYNL